MPGESRAIVFNKFEHPNVTQKGEQRAFVEFTALKTLWFNTGTLCNLACENCYIESSPKNDALVYITAAEVREYLAEIKNNNLPTNEIGLTGGEPFMNPDIIQIMDECLNLNFQLLLLTNAMRPMMKLSEQFLALKENHGNRLEVRVSVDHFEKEKHEKERGRRSWQPMLLGLKWLSDQGFNLAVAGRLEFGENESQMRKGYASLFEKNNINLNAFDKSRLILFPEMDEKAEVPEITTGCWDILNLSPDNMMCASSRMVIKRKGEKDPVIAACTLLPYDKSFEMGQTLAEASGPVKLNHPHCAKFCVLGGGSCS